MKLKHNEWIVKEIPINVPGKAMILDSCSGLSCSTVYCIVTGVHLESKTTDNDNDKMTMVDPGFANVQADLDETEAQ